MRYVQRESFVGLQDERIACLDPFLDEEGIIRLRTRIAERADAGDLLRPIQRVYPLEIHDEELPKPDKTSTEVTPEAQETAASLEKDRKFKLEVVER
jgi:hypothetical protein